MKVKELIDLLYKCNPETRVINDYEDEVCVVREEIDHIDGNNSVVRLC